MTGSNSLDTPATNRGDVDIQGLAVMAGRRSVQVIYRTGVNRLEGLKLSNDGG